MKPDFKTLLLALALAVSACPALRAGVKTVTVREPGTLAAKVGKKNKYSVRALKIKGTLNAADVCFLRDMAGGDTVFKPTPGVLVDIDLSETDFQPGPGSHLGSKSKYIISGRHSLPPVFLYNCPVERLVLPQRLDSIGPWALSNTNIRELIVPDGVFVNGRGIAGDTLLQTLRLPAMKNQALTPVQYSFPALRSVSYGDVDYVVSGGFKNLPELEEIVFEGLVGHIDGYVITDCPKLRRIHFRGPVASTGGAQFVRNCPELEEVIFDGLVFATGFGEPIDCPKLKGYTQNGVVLDGDSAVFSIGSLADVVADPAMREQAQRIMDYKSRTLSDPTYSFLEQIEVMNFPESVKLAEALGDKEFAAKYAPTVTPILEDMEKTKLQLLKESPTYAADTVEYIWSYAAPSDSVLALDREYFNLDSIAGQGDDISRIKNLMYWVHDAVRHDGNSYNPESKSLIDLYEICRREDRGVNCRMMAIMLTEALLAEGIPARYLTCQPKLWAFDSDCHVICMAWSESLGKWVWVDPTFAAFVTDENGLMLHTGEVRERLIADQPLTLNPDANWNHKSEQTKENYLDRYMAKNLYYISAVTRNRPRPEGTGAGKSTHVLLAPVGVEKAPRADIITSDADRFWAPPSPRP